MVTFLNPSMGECKFLVGVAEEVVTEHVSVGLQLYRGSVIVWLLIFWGFGVFMI